MPDKRDTVQDGTPTDPCPAGQDLCAGVCVNLSQDPAHCGDCTTVCPAKVYEWEADHKKIVVNYENCIECGACRMLCPYDNIACEWPRGGFGVQYKLG